jgi:predicted DNA-binding transcriptional regulator AlpA
VTRLSIHRAEAAGPISGADASTGEAARSQGGLATQLPPLLIDIRGLAALLARSIPSLHRDDAAGRLPAALRIGGSKRWRYSDIVEWVGLGCPPRACFEAARRNRP